jgi:hypothetical protein
VYRIEDGRGTLEALSEVPIGERPMWVNIVDLNA